MAIPACILLQMAWAAVNTWEHAAVECAVVYGLSGSGESCSLWHDTHIRWSTAVHSACASCAAVDGCCAICQLAWIVRALRVWCVHSNGSMHGAEACTSALPLGLSMLRETSSHHSTATQRGRFSEGGGGSCLRSLWASAWQGNDVPWGPAQPIPYSDRVPTPKPPTIHAQAIRDILEMSEDQRPKV